MKSYIFLLLSIFILKSSIAQSSGPEPLVMSIEKKVIRNNEPDTVILQFKPGRVLKIKTSEGKILRSANYVYQDSAIVMFTSTEYGEENTDTVLFQDIVKIRGPVYGNAERKAGGAILALTGLPLSFMGYIVATIASTPTGAVIMMLPGIGLSVSGINLMGARSFNTSDKWTLKTTSSANSQINQDKVAKTELIKDIDFNLQVIICR